MADEIIKVLDDLCKKFGIVIDWTSSNVIPYLEELCGKFIKWEIGTSIAWIVISIIVAILFLIFAKISDWDETMCLFMGCVIFVAFIIIGFQIFDIIECYTFPEKAIYDYIDFHTDIFK